ncbi:MAG: type IV secretion protein DotH [Alphaproteobacteria bacterium]|nr:type IV secretion protein DotH [Alphaproteobacteria bacterium]MDE2337067.1 type IV secretion protein DotH [Alphaproteobacteria bacterium]
MKRLFWGLSLIALFGIGCSTAYAQSDSNFDQELQAFQKSNGAGGANPSPSAPAASAASSAPAAADNPLGPAGNLPLAKPAPATAKALGMNVPVETPEQLAVEAAAQKKKMQQETFDTAVHQLLPMTPDEIRELLDIFKKSRQAAETPIADPVPKVVLKTVSLAPDQMPLVIHTSPDRVTTLSILDSSGAPWPIRDVSWAGKFDVTAPETGGSVVRITPQSAHTTGNVSIRLLGLTTPVTFTLETGLKEVDYRFDARIPKRGPLAKPELIANDGLKTAVGGDANLVQILDGTPPSGAAKLEVDGTDGRTEAWSLTNNIYLRTPLTLLSPGWSASVTSADGTNVYVLNDTPVVLLSDGGKMVRVHIAAAEDTP